MAHDIEYWQYSKKTNKKDILSEIREYVEREDYDEGGTYSSSQMHWHDDVVYDSEDEARDAIDRMDNGWYDDHAVLFKDTSGLTKKTKRMDTIEARIKETKDKKADYIQKHQITNRTSDTITCPKCRSRISLAYYHGTHYCPVCGAELYSQTVQNAIKRYDDKVAELEKEMQAEQKKAAQKVLSKAPVKWLVKFEFHY